MREKPDIFRQFASLCRQLKIDFYLVKINGLFSKIIVNISFRFCSDIQTINSLEFSIYLKMKFEYILNKVRRQKR